MKKSFTPSEPVVAPASWDQLLKDAVNKPGSVLAAYSAFHNYSVGNQQLAYAQCLMRGIEPGPLGTFKFWLSKNRPVRKGEKSLILCQPITFKKEKEDKDTGEIVTMFGKFFKYQRGWFVLPQTEGEEYVPDPLPDWDAEKALEGLDIKRIKFEMLNGNVQGYANSKGVAINPIAEFPNKTLLHELGHKILGHIPDDGSSHVDGKDLERNLKEVEAEATAMIVLESLGASGSEYCRGYIQHYWNSGESIPEKNAQRVFAAANAILKAGSSKGIQ